MTAAEGAYMFYTIHSREGDLYVGVILYLWDDEGTRLLQTWPSSREETARSIVDALTLR
jgi:hypothetical protein